MPLIVQAYAHWYIHTMLFEMWQNQWYAWVGVRVGRQTCMHTCIQTLTTRFNHRVVTKALEQWFNEVSNWRSNPKKCTNSSPFFEVHQQFFQHLCHSKWTSKDDVTVLSCSVSCPFLPCGYLYGPAEGGTLTDDVHLHAWTLTTHFNHRVVTKDADKL